MMSTTSLAVIALLLLLDRVVRAVPLRPEMTSPPQTWLGFERLLSAELKPVLDMEVPDDVPYDGLSLPISSHPDRIWKEADGRKILRVKVPDDVPSGGRDISKRSVSTPVEADLKGGDQLQVEDVDGRLARGLRHGAAPAPVKLVNVDEVVMSSIFQFPSRCKPGQYYLEKRCRDVYR